MSLPNLSPNATSTEANNLGRTLKSSPERQKQGGAASCAMQTARGDWSQAGVGVRRCAGMLDTVARCCAERVAQIDASIARSARVEHV
eukprot:5647834-Pleurochrysis_carterae.AAC.3